MVTYDEAHKSKSGKHVPLVVQTDSIGQEKLVPHDCPLYEKGEKKQQQQQPQPQPQTGNDSDNELEIKVLTRLAVENKDAIHQILRKLDSIQSQLAAK